MTLVEERKAKEASDREDAYFLRMLEVLASKGYSYDIAEEKEQEPHHAAVNEQCNAETVRTPLTLKGALHVPGAETSSMLGNIGDTKKIAKNIETFISHHQKVFMTIHNILGPIVISLYYDEKWKMFNAYVRTALLSTYHPNLLEKEYLSAELALASLTPRQCLQQKTGLVKSASGTSLSGLFSTSPNKGFAGRTTSATAIDSTNSTTILHSILMQYFEEIRAVFPNLGKVLGTDVRSPYALHESDGMEPKERISLSALADDLVEVDLPKSNNYSTDPSSLLVKAQLEAYDSCEVLPISVFADVVTCKLPGDGEILSSQQPTTGMPGTFNQSPVISFSNFLNMLGTPVISSRHPSWADIDHAPPKVDMEFPEEEKDRKQLEFQINDFVKKEHNFVDQLRSLVTDVERILSEPTTSAPDDNNTATALAQDKYLIQRACCLSHQKSILAVNDRFYENLITEVGEANESAIQHEPPTGEDRHLGCWAKTLLDATVEMRNVYQDYLTEVETIHTRFPLGELKHIFERYKIDSKSFETKVYSASKRVGDYRICITNLLKHLHRSDPNYSHLVSAFENIDKIGKFVAHVDTSGPNSTLINEFATLVSREITEIPHYVRTGSRHIVRSFNIRCISFTSPSSASNEIDGRRSTSGKREKTSAFNTHVPARVYVLNDGILIVRVDEKKTDSKVKTIKSKTPNPLLEQKPDLSFIAFQTFENIKAVSGSDNVLEATELGSTKSRTLRSKRDAVPKPATSVKSFTDATGSVNCSSNLLPHVYLVDTQCGKRRKSEHESFEWVWDDYNNWEQNVSGREAFIGIQGLVFATEQEMNMFIEVFNDNVALRRSSQMSRSLLFRNRWRNLDMYTTVIELPENKNESDTNTDTQDKKSDLPPEPLRNDEHRSADVTTIYADEQAETILNGLTKSAPVCAMVQGKRDGRLRLQFKEADPSCPTTIIYPSRNRSNEREAETKPRDATAVYYKASEFEEIYNDRVCTASVASHQKATKNAHLCHLRSLRLQLICNSYRRQRKHTSAPELPQSPSGSGKLQRNASLFNLSGYAQSIRSKKNDKGSQRMRIFLDCVNAVCHHIEKTALDVASVPRKKKVEEREIESILNKLLKNGPKPKYFADATDPTIYVPILMRLLGKSPVASDSEWVKLALDAIDFIPEERAYRFKTICQKNMDVDKATLLSHITAHIGEMMKIFGNWECRNADTIRPYVQQFAPYIFSSGSQRPGEDQSKTIVLCLVANHDLIFGPRMRVSYNGDGSTVQGSTGTSRYTGTIGSGISMRSISDQRHRFENNLYDYSEHSNERFSTPPLLRRPPGRILHSAPHGARPPLPDSSPGAPAPQLGRRKSTIDRRTLESYENDRVWTDPRVPRISNWHNELHGSEKMEPIWQGAAETVARDYESMMVAARDFMNTVRNLAAQDDTVNDLSVKYPSIEHQYKSNKVSTFEKELRRYLDANFGMWSEYLELANQERKVATASIEKLELQIKNSEETVAQLRNQVAVYENQTTKAPKRTSRKVSRDMRIGSGSKSEGDMPAMLLAALGDKDSWQKMAYEFGRELHELRQRFGLEPPLGSTPIPEALLNGPISRHNSLPHPFDTMTQETIVNVAAEIQSKSKGSNGSGWGTLRLFRSK